MAKKPALTQVFPYYKKYFFIIVGFSNHNFEPVIPDWAIL